MRLRTLTTGLSATALILAVSCGRGGAGKLPPASSSSAAPVQGTDIESALNRIFASDGRFRGEAIRTLLRTAFQDPGPGQELWRAALDPAGKPDPDRILKALARPWSRALLTFAVDKDFQDRSAALKAGLKARPADPAYRYDVVVVGSGPNGAVAALNLREARPDLRVAVVEEKALPGDVFRNMDSFIWINSPETTQFSTNEFTGLALAAQDLLDPGAVAPGTPTFVEAKLVCDLNDLALFISGADLWLESEVTGIRRNAASGRLELSIGDPAATLTANRVLITTGLGRKPYYGTPGEAPAEPGDLAVVPGQEHFDHLVARGARRVALNRMDPAGGRVSFMAPYAGKRIAIIGAGDSGNNMAELAAGLAPPEVYGLPRPPGPVQPGPRYGPGIGAAGGPAQVLWVNQKSRDATEFKTANKPRYSNTIPAVFGSFTRIEDRLGGVRREPDGRFTLQLVDTTGAPTREERGVDYVWYGTGYRVSSSAVIRDLTRPGDDTEISGEEAKRFIESLEPVRSTIRVTRPGPHHGREVTTIVGRKLPDPGPLAGVFLGGTVALPLATREELEAYTITKNEASLNANLPRAAALGAWIARLPGYAPVAPPRERDRASRNPLQAEPGAAAHLDLDFARDGGGQPFPPILTERPPEDGARRLAYEDVALRLLAGLHLRRYAASKGFSVKVEDSGPGGEPGHHWVRLHVRGLAHGSATTLLNELKDDRAFLRLALDCADRRPPEGAPRTLCLEVAPSLAAFRPLSAQRIRISAGCAP
ncbi:MAG: FAD-dependent oxidoreductase [Holophaga sp.]